MKILVAVDGSPFTRRMLAYLAAHDEWLGDAHQYTLLHVTPAVPPRAAAVLDVHDVRRGVDLFLEGRDIVLDFRFGEDDLSRVPALLEEGAVGVVVHHGQLARRVSRQRLSLRHPQADLLARALAAVGLGATTVAAGASQLQAELHTASGPVTLHSHP